MFCWRFEARSEVGSFLGVEILKIFSSVCSGPSIHMNVLLCFVTESYAGKEGHKAVKSFFFPVLWC